MRKIFVLLSQKSLESEYRRIFSVILHVYFLHLKPKESCWQIISIDDDSIYHAV